MEIINEEHNNEENALIVQNYPYGFRLKTKIRYYIESNKKGDRFISQTLNPKTNLWNKPKFSIYNAVMVLCKDEKGYISYIGLYPTTSKEDINKFLNTIGNYNLNDFQKEQIKVLKAYSKAYEGVTFSCKDVTNQTEEERLKDEEKQKQTKQIINQRVAYYYKNDN
jgi:hypothetical protein